MWQLWPIFFLKIIKIMKVIKIIKILRKSSKTRHLWVYFWVIKTKDRHSKIRSRSLQLWLGPSVLRTPKKYHSSLMIVASLSQTKNFAGYRPLLSIKQQGNLLNVVNIWMKKYLIASLQDELQHLFALVWFLKSPHPPSSNCMVV